MQVVSGKLQYLQQWQPGLWKGELASKLGNLLYQVCFVVA
jgi:hypothetical protein